MRIYGLISDDNSNQTDMRSPSILVTIFFVVISAWYCDSELVNLAENSNCTTPQNRQGKCVGILKCPALKKLMARNHDPKVVSYINKLQCGFGASPFICCTDKIEVLDEQNEEECAEINPPVDFTRSRALEHPRYCGSMDLESKIYSGTNTSIVEFPWMALFQYKDKKTEEKKFLCGGSLIGPKYILTAAHCVTGDITNKNTLFSVRLGEWNLDTEDDCETIGSVTDCSEKPVDIEIEEVIPHPNFVKHANSLNNDIALIKLKQNVKYSEFITPVCLPSISDVKKPGQQLIVAGWGSTVTSRFSSIKQKLTVPKVCYTRCQAAYKASGITLTESQICAGGEVNKDSCTGDSGGPLMGPVVHNPAKWYIEGIVSFGKMNCGLDGVPGVYTKVWSYIDWIHKNAV